MASPRTEAVHKSFESVANIAFENIPDDIAVYMLLYVRDKATGENGWDWTIDTQVISKNIMLYDWCSIREYIRHAFTLSKE